MTAGKHLQDRLGSVLLRLNAIERRAGAVTDPPRMAARLSDDARKLAGELERAVSDVREILDECARLETERALAAGRTQLLFEVIPVACLFLDAKGTIEDANPEAVRLLNVSRRHLAGRSFCLYLGGERDVFLKRIRYLGDGEDRPSWTADVRPRERSPLRARLTCSVTPEGGLLLVLNPLQEQTVALPQTAAGSLLAGRARSAEL